MIRRGWGRAGASGSHMRIMVFGTGVIGSTYAARLQLAWHQVVVLTQENRLQTIRRDGLLVEDVSNGARTAVKVEAVSALAADDAYDLVLVSVRFDQLDSTLDALARSRCTPHVLFFGNNPIGTEKLVAAIGRERVLLGFPGAGGQREGELIRYLILKQQRTTLGELNGVKTTRIEQIANVFRAAGFPVAISRDMESWLKTHAAFVSLIAAAIYAADGDTAKLARSPELVRLMVRAVRECFDALATLGIREMPFNLRLLHKAMPQWFAIRYWRQQFAGQLGQFSFAAHSNSAKPEMIALARTIHHMLASHAANTPAADELFRRAGIQFDAG
jgi:2-dehydropantoate 2-reductase